MPHPRLDASTLTKLGRLALIARGIVEGFLSGLHKSPYKGFSVEFAEHRQYYPGDEIRHVDWRVFGKTDRYYIKEFEEETNLRAHVVLDASGSMAYRGAGPGKFAHAQQIAAALTYLMLHQLDAVGLVIHDTAVREFLPPHAHAKHLLRVLDCLEKAQPGGETSLASVWHGLAGRIKRRGLVILLSDCFDKIDPLLLALRHLRHRGHEVLLFHLLAREELDFPFSKWTQFRNLENADQRTFADPRQLRPLYRKNFDAFCERLRIQAGNMGIDYHRILTDEPVEKTLGHYLTIRRRR